MKKYIIIAIAIFGIMLMPHFSFAMSTTSSLPYVSASGTQLVFGSFTGNSTPIYIFTDVETSFNASTRVGCAGWYGCGHGGDSYSATCQLSSGNPNIGIPFTAGGGCNGGNLMSTYSSSTAQIMTIWIRDSTGGGGDTWIYFANDNGTLCFSSSPTDNFNCGTPPSPTIAWNAGAPNAQPAEGTTAGDFETWSLNLANVSTTLYNQTVVIDYYNLAGENYSDQNTVTDYSVSSTIVTPKSISLSLYNTSSTWAAIATLIAPNGTLLATSSILHFTIDPTQSENTSGIYPSSTFPGPYIPGTLASTSNQFATSTCNWGDVGCALGNVFDNIMNFIFGIDNAEIQSIAGFNIATTKPFSLISDIQNDFANVHADGTMPASTTFTGNLGQGNFNVDIFDPKQAQVYFGAAGPILRNLCYAVMVILLIYGFYLEIKEIFIPED